MSVEGRQELQTGLRQEARAAAQVAKEHQDHHHDLRAVTPLDFPSRL